MKENDINLTVGPIFTKCPSCQKEFILSWPDLEKVYRGLFVNNKIKRLATELEAERKIRKDYEDVILAFSNQVERASSSTSKDAKSESVKGGSSESLK